MGDLTRNFSRAEFRCPCGCKKEEVQIELVGRLQIARDEFGPIAVTSGVRCPEHNRKVGGLENSAHLTGWAADLACYGDRYRFQLLETLRMAGFTRFGIANSFIHVDQDPRKPKEVVWIY